MFKHGWAVALAAAGGIASLAGCGHCEDHEAAEASYQLGKFNYESGKFDQAKILYTRCVEKCQDYQLGWLGLANACREDGNDQFKGAAEMAAQGRVQDSKKLFKNAVENHALAYQIFTSKLKEFPDDPAPHYGLGLMYYQRSTSILPFPFPVDDKINRQKERDQSIKEFSIIVEKAPNAYQAHRYLGLALFAAGRMEEGRPHLKIFHDAEQALYEKVLQWPAGTDEEKIHKDKNLKSVEKEISDIRDVLSEYFMSVQHDIEKLELRPSRKPEEQQELARLKAESFRLEIIIKGFHLTNLSDVEIQVRRRCDDFLTVFNRGQVAEIMSFLAPSEGQEAAMQKSLRDKVEIGTKFRKPQYRTIVVAGDSASVALACEYVTNQGSRPDFDLTMHWHLVSGQWRLLDPP